MKPTPSESSTPPPARGSDLRLRLAGRQLRRAPGAAIYAAVTLAVGLGAAIAIHSVKASFNAPLPVPDGEQVVQVRLVDPKNKRTALRAADLRAWRDESRSMRRLGAFSTFEKTVSDPDRSTRRVLRRATRLVAGATVPSEVFGLLGVRPRLGRVPERQLADEAAVVISHRLWQGWFEGDPGVLGRTFRLNGETRTVVGVLPEGFRFPFHEDLWQVRDLDTVGASGLEVVARLDRGTSRERAGQELTAILRRSHGAVDGAAGSTASARVHGFTEKRGEGAEVKLMQGLFWLVVALTLVSCLNVSNLLLERAAARARSLAVHQALGAAPGQAALQVLVEALLIAALGAALGLAVACGIVFFVQTSLVHHWDGSPGQDVGAGARCPARRLDGGGLRHPAGLARPPQRPGGDAQAGGAVEPWQQGVGLAAAAGRPDDLLLPRRPGVGALRARHAREPPGRGGLSRRRGDLYLPDLRRRPLRRSGGAVLAVLGGLGAVLVVTIGLYGLLACDVRRRLPEFAVRLALGAGTGRVLAGVLRHAALLVLPGVALGLGLTYLVTPLLGVHIGAADSHDPRVFGGALTIYALVLLFAAVSPARRAAGCRIAALLREE